MSTQYPALIVIVPLMSALICFVVGWWNRNFCYKIAVAAIAVSFYSSVVTMKDVMANGVIHYWVGSWEPPWGIEYVVDYLNGYMLIIITFISLLAVISSKKSVEKDFPEKAPAFYSIFLLLVTGLVGITITGDVFNVYVFLEIASIAAYALIAIGKRDHAPMASFNYVIYGTVGACFYLIGVGYLYMVTGSLNMADLAKLLPDLYNSKVVLVGFAFLLVGVCIKMALFPLHMWLPDAYSLAPDSVSSLIAPLMTKVSAYVMIRIMFTIFQPVFSFEMLPVGSICGWLAVIAIFVGGIRALAQKDLKNMLVYILVAEVGYIVIGISVGNRIGLTGAILHIMNDAAMMACLFLIVGAIAYKTGITDITQFRHMNQKMPFTMAAFTITALSMVGLPPACGFFSKWYLVLGAINANQWVLVVTLLISSLINAILFFRVIEYAYFYPHPEHGAEEHVHATSHGHAEIVMNEAPLSMLIPILIMATLILVLGPFSGKIISSIIQFAIPAGF
ncbi:MAG: monovalent cation/H+ antiporter subunit D family protein [Proteobacteria bacterium]|nr:monovalent cation/H+ antiporter subunit D family protein [Pseudomonadota bacterium]